MPTTPSPGDVVRMADGRRAVIDGGNHYGRDHVMAVVGASAFWGSSHGSGEYVSCSGGPCPCIPKSQLLHAGTTEQTFWRWKDRPRRDGGENFTRTVNLWTWEGTA